MTQNQENKFSMYLVVQKILQSYQLLWSGIPAFVTAYNNFGAIILGIGGDIQKQMAGSEGPTTNKGEAKKIMIEKTVDIQGALISYAAATKNHILKKKVEMSKSDIDGLRDGEVGEFCQMIWNEANPLGGALANYGVTGPELNSLQLSITTYKGLIATPRIAVAEVSVATGDLKSLFKQGDEVLDLHLDQLMKGFASSQPEFLAKYTSGRIIVDNNGGGGAEENPDVPPVE